ncbi:TonB-dependent siderophore receptor [Plasticicumulans acidivorans]|uniref:Iron complex outermembrane receptor protein n=1 Tax=Plasticicumulans acidivorans TaxID=886464 RepID=A0A317MW03_9GAMM|nr:TonB-dependent receptor [Plasticicumulans acidivorans]PWV63086.1 iron complex outermembrane receptor protein [Plasticicumulans acidivorans]
MTVHRHRRAPLALGLLGLPSAVFAAGADTAVELEPVVVTAQSPDDGSAASGYRVERVDLGPLGAGSRRDSPLSVSTVPAELIRNTQASNTTEALKYVPTVYASTGASQITPYFSMRGFSASTWSYNMALDGLRSFDIYEPLEDKQGIEVLSGAAGFLYGITSPAGIVNYLSKRPLAEPLAALTVGSYDHQLYSQLDLGGPLAANPDLLYRLNLGYANAGTTGAEQQSQQRYVGSGALSWRLSADTRIDLEAAAARRELDHAQALFMTTAKIGIPDAPDASDNWGAPYTGASDETRRLGGAFETRLNDTFTLRGRVRHSEIEREYFLNRIVWQNRDLDYRWRVDSQQRFTTTVDQYSLFLDADFTTGTLHHHMSFGATRDEFDAGDNGYRGTTYSTVYAWDSRAHPAWQLPPAGTSTAQDTTYTTLLLADRIDIGEQWSLLLGVNRAGIDDEQTATSASGKRSVSRYDADKATPIASLSFRPLETLTTYFTYAEALQQGFVAGSTTANAGETFSPFVSKQSELGARLALGGVDLNLAWFRIRQANQYVDPGTNLASQDGRVVHQGWEFSLSGKPSERLTLVGGFTLLDARIDKATANVGKVPQGVAENMARLYAEYELPGVPGLTLTGGVSYVGKVPWDAANTLYVDPVTLFDAGLRYRSKLYGKETTWRLNIANLTGEDYWSTRSGILYLGSPRTVSLSATVAF